MRADRRERTVIVLGSLAYGLLFAIGSQIDACGMLDAGKTAVRFVCAAPLAALVLHLLYRCVFPRLECRGEKGARRFFTVCVWAILFACYVPMFLIQYPGSFTYDTLQQAYQAAGDRYNTFHPLLHTLFLRLCIGMYSLVGSFEKCLALCSLIQMALVSGIFAQICASVSRMVSRRAGMAAAVFFALYPVHMALASTYTKDVLFSACFALFVTLCIEEGCGGRLGGWTQLLRLAAGVLACLLRNNMIYAMVVWAALLLAARRHARRLLACAAAVIVLALTANAGLIALTDAKEGKVAEMLSVPIQQIARARLYAPERFTQEELDQMDAYFLPSVRYEKYEKGISDPIKNEFNNAYFAENPKGAAKLWLSIGRKCPGIYFEAFFNLALPSLYPYRHYDNGVSYIEIGSISIGLTDAYGLPKLIQPQRFEGIRSWLNEHIYVNGLRDIPLLRFLLNTGAVYWTLLALWLYDLYRGDRSRALIFMLPVLLWGTYLLGPVMQGRYLYPFVCCLPLFALRPAKAKAE